MGRMLLDFLSLYWCQNNSCKTTQLRTVFKFPIHTDASCSLRKRGMFHLQSTFCLKNEPMNERRYVSLRVILAFVAWRGTLLWSVIGCGLLWNRRAQPHRKPLIVGNCLNQHKIVIMPRGSINRLTREVEKVITKCDIAERGKHREGSKSCLAAVSPTLCFSISVSAWVGSRDLDRVFTELAR